ncbi:hypothetical protein IQ249_12875 [Lusitaniella coriacea LEGE 07157]|uniref:Uncharacterized protein n=1 Tax=Lusitaniella coriacea LEGE 07157 TaxID=945747 RepID=A0A8J7DYK5_9CYAN|nr:hypothetical protein [Lusitaniella coriacea]MBE9116793.1 hypothetical protein [Lusitaniella coriacea LEGE 07157]
MNSTQLSIAFAGLLFVIAIALGALAFYKLSGWKILDRAIVAIAPAICILSFLFAFNQFLIRFEGIQWGVKGNWSAVRLLPSFALKHGYQIYYDPNSGPITGMIKGPMMALAYLPVTLGSSPVVAVILGSLTATTFFFVPILWLHFGKSWKDVQTFIISLFAFLFFCLLVVISPVLRYVAFSVHADAIALGLSAASCAVLYYNQQRDRFSTLFLSAIFVVLAIWTKQVSLPIIVAIPLFLLLAEGWRCCKRYLLCLFISGISISAILIAIFDPKALFFYLFVVPSNHPWQGEAGKVTALLQTAKELFNYSFWPLVILGCVLLYHLFLNVKRKTAISLWFKQNPWILFVLVGIFLVPTAVLGKVKVGGDINNFGYSLYFTTTAASLALMQLAIAAKIAEIKIVAQSVKIAVLALFSALILFQSPKVFALIPTLSANLAQGFEKLEAFPSQVAYRYAKNHPEEAYFPWQTLSTLMADGKMYHFEYGLFDLDLAGFPASEEQFYEYLPENMKIIAFLGRNDGYVLKRLPEFSRKIEVEELPGWEVYAREE